MSTKENVKMTITEEPTETTARPWTITWKDRVWTESDVTGKHLAVLSLIAGRDDFDLLEMSPANGHQRLMMMISACVAVEAAESISSEDADEIAKVVAESVDEVSRASADEILGALTFD